MKKVLSLFLLVFIFQTALAASSFSFGYSGGNHYANYYSTAGAHGSQAYDNYDGSYQKVTTNTSGATTYAKTPAKISNGYVSGNYKAFE